MPASPIRRPSTGAALADLAEDDLERRLDDLERRLDRTELLFVLVAQIVAGSRDIGRLHHVVGAGPASAGSLGDRVGRPFVDHVMAIQAEREARK